MKHIISLQSSEVDLAITQYVESQGVDLAAKAFTINYRTNNDGEVTADIDVGAVEVTNQVPEPKKIDNSAIGATSDTDTFIGLKAEARALGVSFRSDIKQSTLQTRVDAKNAENKANATEAVEEEFVESTEDDFTDVPKDFTEDSDDAFLSDESKAEDAALDANTDAQLDAAHASLDSDIAEDDEEELFAD